MGSQGVRILWILIRPESITDEIIQEEAEKLGFIRHVTFPDGTKATLSHKLRGGKEQAGLSPEESIRLRDACFLRAGINDPEEYYSKLNIESKIYQDWLKDRIAHPPTYKRNKDKK